MIIIIIINNINNNNRKLVLTAQWNCVSKEASQKRKNNPKKNEH